MHASQIIYLHPSQIIYNNVSHIYIHTPRLYNKMPHTCSIKAYKIHQELNLYAYKLDAFSI
jgi:hypothetical protein